MQQQDVERIAKGALRELGIGDAAVTVTPDERQPDCWRIHVGGGHGPSVLKIRCGAGSTPQWIRVQIFEQFQSP